MWSLSLAVLSVAAVACGGRSHRAADPPMVVGGPPRAAGPVVVPPPPERGLSPREVAAESELAEAQAFCVAELNRYRVVAGPPPLARSEALERCALAAAVQDGKNQVAHQHFQETSGCGVAMAENELPWWGRGHPDGTVRGVIALGVQQMWEEGPGGGHFDNLTHPDYTEVGCGIYWDRAADMVTVVWDFR